MFVVGVIKYDGGNMKKIEDKQELGLVLPALIVSSLLETGRPPSIVDVESLSFELADEMRKLGYEELTADLLLAFLKTGDVEKLDPEQIVDLEGPAVTTFIGG